MAKAIVAKVSATITILGAEKIQVAVVLGENCIVSKEVQIGDVGILFPADTQLSLEYVKANNLHRHAELNSNPEKTGFFDDNRRVRVQPFMKIKSTAYFASIDSLNFAGELVPVIGQSFDSLNNVPICNKYISQATRDKIAREGKPKQAKKDFAPYFEKHVDSAQFKHSLQLIPKGALLSFHAKVHGTSARMAYTLLSVELPAWKLMLNKITPIFPTEKWDYVVGTRNVVLTDNANGFHGSEQFRYDVLESVKPFMTKGMTIFGEIAGYANGKPIMATHSGKNTKDKAFVKKYGDSIVYKYGCKEHEYRFHVYRITLLTHDGKNVEMPQHELEQWCANFGVLGPLEVHPKIIYDGDADSLAKLVESLTERPECLSEDYIDSSHPSEGIIVRIDNGNSKPTFLKSKAYYFRTMEGLCEAFDAEDAA